MGEMSMRMIGIDYELYFAWVESQKEKAVFR